MSIRTQSFYRAEKRLYVGAIICGCIFISLFFMAAKVEQIFYYLFYTLSAYGLIYLISYSTKYLSLNRCSKKVINNVSNSLSAEKTWVENRLKESKLNRSLQTGVLFIGFAVVIIAFGGYNKTIMGGSGAGLLLGSAVWLAIELISHLQTGEYLQYLEKKSE